MMQIDVATMRDLAAATDECAAPSPPGPADLGLNTVELTGLLIQEPELHSLSDGTSVCHLRLAVMRMGREDRTGIIDVHTFGKTARGCASSLSKGWVVAVAGRLEYGEWEDAAGGTRSGHSVSGHLVRPVRLRSGRRITRLRRPAGGTAARPVADQPATSRSED